MSSGLHELRVERHRGMIDVYRLVGLARWESDSSRIQRAIAEARLLLDQHRQTGTPREHSQISGYVTEAERILTDAARKLKYDVSLRRALEESGEETVRPGDECKMAALGRPASFSDEQIDVRVNETVDRTPTSGLTTADRTWASGLRAKVEPTIYRSRSRTRTAEGGHPTSDSLGERLIDGVRDSATRFAGWCADWWEALHGGYPIRFTLALVSAGGVLLFWLSRMDWSDPFPQSTVAPKPAGEQTTTAVLSPKPKVESIPGQRVGVPRTVPGLDEIAGYAPTLNAKLTTIVFAAEAGDGEQRSLDLFEANRDKAIDPFRKPERIATCCTTDVETDPTLSPDGLELVFVRSAKSGRCELLRSVRESLTSSFSEPQPIEIPKLLSGDGAQLDSPQLLRDGGDLIVRVTQKTPSGSTSNYFLAQREGLDRPFEKAESLAVFVDQARHFLTSNGLRAFVSRYYTIQLCCRPSLEARFSLPGKLDALNSTRIGNAEGPIWVSPAEDFLFYCVTVTNSSKERRRYLWQVRFR